MNEDILYIRKFLSGDAEGFAMLVRKYQDRVLNIIYSLIGQDRESEDIAQEAFLKVYHNLGSFRQQSQFSTWLYRIVVNTAYDFLRKRKNFVSNEVAIEKSVSSYDSPAQALLRKEKNAILEKALVKVPLQYRAALILKDIEGLSYGQISEVLGCNIGTVESKIYRARQFLKQELFKLGGDLI